MDDLEAVLFDLDSTLCVHDQDPAVLWDRAFERAGVDPPVAPEAVAGVDPESTPVVESEHEFFRALYEVAVEQAGATPDDGTADAVAEAYRTVWDPSMVSFREDAREALATAREQYAVGLVTNGGRDTQTEKLDSLGIREAFDAEVYCDPRAGIDPKPDPTAVELALEDLGVSADRTVLVGDSLRADVGGAHNAGSRSAWVPHQDRERDPHPQPDHVCEGMAEVAALLDG